MGASGHLDPRPAEEPPQRLRDLLRGAVVGARRREENYVEAVPRKGARAGGLTQDPLAPVPEDGVPKPLGSDEGDPSRDALVVTSHSDSQETVVVAPPA